MPIRYAYITTGLNFRTNFRIALELTLDYLDLLLEIYL